MLPTYEVMMRETFSPISPTPLSPILPDLPDLIEEATRSLQEDVKPTTEVRAAPPADTPVVPGVDEAGFTVGNESRCTAFPRQPLVQHAERSHRGGSDSRGGGGHPLFENLHTGTEPVCRSRPASLRW